jgi:ribosomal protein S18 acetylase RimI-like enzyme
MDVTTDIRQVTTQAELDLARGLFREYAEGLDFDLDFQDFEREMEALPGPYAPPGGAILLAEVDGDVAGTVAVKPLGEEDDGTRVCEMKRLYVRPAFRRSGVGSALASAIVDVAREIGYDVMRLDTVASMTAARALYRSLGFEERDAYYHNPLPDAVYMEKGL